MSTTSGTVSVRAQSRCSSQARGTQPMGLGARPDDAFQTAPVRLGTHPANRVDNREHLIALAERVRRREC
jgi:hypothetical protein